MPDKVINLRYRSIDLIDILQKELYPKQDQNKVIRLQGFSLHILLRLEGKIMFDYHGCPKVTLSDQSFPAPQKRFIQETL